MLNSSMNYPYPVLRGTLVDYKKSVFSAEITKRDLSNGFELEITYHVNNDDINRMIDERVLTYALQIQCTSTWYRKLEISPANKQKVIIPAEDVHEKVEMCPCIVALKDIPHFENYDFSEDFEGISFELHRGEVAGIGERQKFDAIYQNDIIKKGDPIVHFQSDENAGVMRCKFEENVIQIVLPASQYQKYNEICMNEPWKIDMVNAVYVVPVIVQAINEIYLDDAWNGGGVCSSYSWYKTLKVLIQKAAKDDLSKYKNMLEDSIETAQLLLNDNSSQALNLIADSTR